MEGTFRPPRFVLHQYPLARPQMIARAPSPPQFTAATIMQQMNYKELTKVASELAQDQQRIQDTNAELLQNAQQKLNTRKQIEGEAVVKVTELCKNVSLAQAANEAAALRVREAEQELAAAKQKAARSQRHCDVVEALKKSAEIQVMRTSEAINEADRESHALQRSAAEHKDDGAFRQKRKVSCVCSASYSYVD
jgi:hypothetical protein